MKTKHCIKCNTTKSVNKFGKDKSNIDNLAYYCKICKSKIAYKYRNTSKGKKTIEIYRLSEGFQNSISKYKNSSKYKATILKMKNSKSYKDKQKLIALENTKKLNDSYIKILLSKAYGIRNPSSACLELKRMQIQELRLIKKLKKEV